MKLKKKFLIVFLHLLLWVCYYYFFLQNYMMRPLLSYPVYKRLIILFATMFFCYLNYLYLVPKFYNSNSPAKYRIILVSLIFFLSVIEFLIILPEYRFCLLFIQAKKMKLLITIQHSLFVIIRNTCLFGLFSVYKINTINREQILMEQKATIDNGGIFNILLSKNEVKTVKLSDIVYIKHIKNYTYFHINDHNVYSMYVSMLRIEEMLPKDKFRRINRNTIINTSYILSEDENLVTLSFSENKDGENICFQISGAFN